ncbi:MAG: FAD-dependent oxidoreductase, partial [Bacteroidetes bacterium]|nr:FAD-dependent oxidoreductase [Bacteroidota bacterium]
MDAKRIVILGAGTAGTMMANHLRHQHALRDWEIVIIDEREVHYYQPGFLFLPFDIYQPEDIVKPIREFMPDGVHLVTGRIESIQPDQSHVLLSDGTSVRYDILIVATGARPVPEEVQGMVGPEWRRSIFDFYTYEGALALRDKLRKWEGGRLVVHIAEMPIKCPVAPLEFSFLA